jgi:hypothetical protein
MHQKKVNKERVKIQENQTQFASFFNPVSSLIYFNTAVLFQRSNTMWTNKYYEVKGNSATSHPVLLIYFNTLQSHFHVQHAPRFKALG